MTSLFSPKTPSPATPKPPAQSSPEVMAAADAERRRQRSASGRAATELTGGSGSMAPTVGTKTLLGQ